MTSDYFNKIDLALEESFRRCSYLKPPEMICLAGVPGSGKTEFIKRRLLADHIDIDPDKFRKYAPDYYCLPSDELIRGTNDIVNNIVMHLLERSIEKESSFVIPSTFTNVAFWDELFEKMHAQLEKRHYIKKLIVLKQPVEESCRGYALRAEAISEDEPKPRPFDMFFFMGKCEAFKDSIDYFESHPIFDEVIIMARERLEDEYQRSGL